MNRTKCFRFFRLLVMAGFCLSPAVGYSQAPADPNAEQGVWVQIHLPREITVSQSVLDLSLVAVIRGSPQWATVAGRIGLGRLSLPGQKIVLDRATILSRLVASGIPADRVLLTGADAVTVKNGQKIIGSEEFVLAGQQFLRELLASRLVAEMTAMVKPKDLALVTEPQGIQLVPQVVRTDARGLVTVQVRVVAGGRELGVRDIPFRLKFEVRQAVVTKEIPQGAALSTENVRIEKRLSERPEPADWRPPYGFVAVRTLAADQEVRPDMAATPEPAILVRRNEAVTIRIERPGLMITAMGTSLQEGRAGDSVKVRNADSSRIIVCKVNTDGTVEPVL
jgi:flagellar basal body P-ring formation protein FlgA